MKNIKDIVAKNLTLLRLEKKWTQFDVAKALNYTDKSVSKWEHGDAMPPIETLVELSNLYNVSLDYLTTENPEDNFGKMYSAKENSTNKVIITALAVSIVWIVATVLFVYNFTIYSKSNWQLFVYAVPVSSIVLLVFNGIWGKRSYTFVITSILVWSLLSSIFVLMIASAPWAIFILGIPAQLVIVLWSNLKPNKK